MLQDFSAGYYLLNATVYRCSDPTPSMYVDDVWRMRSQVGVDRIVGKLGRSHFEISPSGALPDGALALPEAVYRATDARPGRNRVLIAKEQALDVLDAADVLS